MLASGEDAASHGFELFLCRQALGPPRYYRPAKHFRLILLYQTHSTRHAVEELALSLLRRFPVFGIPFVCFLLIL